MKLHLNKLTYYILSIFISITLFYQPVLALENFYPPSLNGSNDAPMKNSFSNKNYFTYVIRPIEEIDDAVIQYNSSGSFKIGDYFDSEYMHKWNPNITENTKFVNLLDYSDDNYSLNDFKLVLSKVKLAFDNYAYIYERSGNAVNDSTKYPFDPEIPVNTTYKRLIPTDRICSLHHYLVYYDEDYSTSNTFLNEIYQVNLSDLSYARLFDEDVIETINDKQYTLRAFNSSASGLCNGQSIVFSYNVTTDTCAFNPIFIQDHVYPFLQYSPALSGNTDYMSYEHTNSFKIWPKKNDILAKWTYELQKIQTSKKYYLSQNLLQVFEASFSQTDHLTMFGTSRVIGIWDNEIETYQYNKLNDYPMFDYGPINFDPLYQNSYTISLSSNNLDYGTVQGGGTFESGSTITIKAIPNSNAYRFVEWSDHNTDQDRELFVNADYSITAIFAPKTEYTITLNSEPEISGHFSGNGNCFDGDTVEIEAIPYKGYSFSHWSDGNEDQKRNLLVSDNIELTAYFTEGGLSGKINDGPIITVIIIAAFLLMLKGF